uniref:Uncharacterized protein n=1 Tax=Glossina austeni TaxID=7395 RepID=A0A1A9VXI6_GLOAU
MAPTHTRTNSHGSSSSTVSSVAVWLCGSRVVAHFETTYVIIIANGGGSDGSGGGGGGGLRMRIWERFCDYNSEASKTTGSSHADQIGYSVLKVFVRFCLHINNT